LQNQLDGWDISLAPESDVMSNPRLLPVSKAMKIYLFKEHGPVFFIPYYKRINILRGLTVVMEIASNT
jgi:hypothetical protein